MHLTANKKCWCNQLPTAIRLWSGGTKSRAAVLNYSIPKVLTLKNEMLSSHPSSVTQFVLWNFDVDLSWVSQPSSSSYRFVFFSRSWQKQRPLLPSSNYNLQYIPFIVTTYSAHVVFKCNAFTNRIGVCYQVCYCTPCQIYLNYSTRLHSTYIKRWGFYGLIIGDQRAQTCCISINFLRKFWSGSVEESLSGPPILS